METSEMSADPTCVSHCTAVIRLSEAEYAFVAELPDMEMWWADLPDITCCDQDEPKSSPSECAKALDVRTVSCCLQQGHQGEHAALVGRTPCDGDQDAYVFWSEDAPEAREIRQPQGCEKTENSDASHYLEVRCLLFKNHPGPCRF
ncbi:hypothetical protein [Salinactinospora qingdaonensis]|uniref:hypothetical protein n=1 Tax=Salinactinospora qingdaonensis TaxID=702744 RepID=UPI0031EE1451